MRFELLRGGSIRCVCSVCTSWCCGYCTYMLEYKSGDVLEGHDQSVASRNSRRNSKNNVTHLGYSVPAARIIPRIAAMNNKNHHQGLARHMCAVGLQESRNSLPSRWMERAESSGAAMAGLPARPRVPSPSLPIDQHRLVRLLSAIAVLSLSR